MQIVNEDGSVRKALALAIVLDSSGSMNGLKLRTCKEAIVKVINGYDIVVCFVLFCFVLFCFVLFCFVLFCFVLFCFVLFCFVLFCFVLFCFVYFVIVGLAFIRMYLLTF